MHNWFGLITTNQQKTALQLRTNTTKNTVSTEGGLKVISRRGYTVMIREYQLLGATEICAHYWCCVLSLHPHVDLRDKRPTSADPYVEGTVTTPSVVFS
jgi:hypothetical protein